MSQRERISGSYRVKFNKENFLKLVDIAKPKIIYNVKRMHFFAFDGFAMYSFHCKNEDFDDSILILPAFEFSNTPWSEIGTGFF